MPGDVTLWPNLSGGEVIDLLARLRGGLDEKRKAVLLEKFELDPTKKSRAYSKGNRQKVALIAALSAGSELLILDEPTSGLDPLMEAAFRECVEEERQAGRTVLLSSHILSEVEALCDRVTIIRAGRTVDSGALADLRHLSRTSVRAELARPPAGLDQLPGLHDLDIEGTRVSCQADNSALDELLERLTAAGVRSLVSQPPTLEELFLRHYTDAAMSAVAPRAHRSGLSRRGSPVLAGTGTLAKLALRRDRIFLAIWLYALVGSMAAPRTASAACTRDRGASGLACGEHPAQPVLPGAERPGVRRLAGRADHLEGLACSSRCAPGCWVSSR